MLRKIYQRILSTPRNIWLYILFQVFREPTFWGPIIIIYIQKIGRMGLSQIYNMEAIVCLGLILLQVPTGALADLIGRKRTILMGEVLIIISAALFAMVSSPTTVWVANIFCMIGFALCDGADSSLLYDDVLQGADFKKIEGLALSIRYLLVAVCALSTMFIKESNDMRVLMWLSIIGPVISCAAISLIKETRTKFKFNFNKQWQLITSGFRLIRKKETVIWIISFHVLVVVVSKVWFFTYNPYFELVGIKIQHFGIFFFVLNLIAALFSWKTSAIHTRIGEFVSIALIIILLGVPIMCMGTFLSIFAASMIFLQNTVRGYMNPFLGEMLNRYIASDNRATVMSIRSMATEVFRFLGLGFFGWLLTVWSLPVCLNTLGMLTLVVGSVLIVWYKKINWRK